MILAAAMASTTAAVAFRHRHEPDALSISGVGRGMTLPKAVRSLSRIGMRYRWPRRATSSCAASFRMAGRPQLDGLWVLNWEDAEAMAWAALRPRMGMNVKCQNCVLSQERAHVDPLADVIRPERHSRQLQHDAPPYYLTNQLCIYKEGKSGADSTWFAIIAGCPVDCGEQSGQLLLVRVEAPDFTPLEAYPIDFNWVNFEGPR